MDGHSYRLDPADPPFYLHAALRLYFDNGGSRCFVVSVGNYWGSRDVPPDRTKPPVAVAKNRLLDGLAVSRGFVGPSMLVIPEACLLADPSDYSAIAVAQLEQAGALRDRVAILDPHRIVVPETFSKDGLAALRDAFYGHIAPAAANFGFGTAYAPALNTTLLGEDDVDYTDLQSDALKPLLLDDCNTSYRGDPAKIAQVTAMVEQAIPATPPSPPPTPQRVQALNQNLVVALPLLQQIETLLLARLNIAPPSGAIAGIWAANDANRGVWQAPANIPCASVLGPTVKLSETDQGAYNVPLNGNAIDLIRQFPGAGPLVWGARTLDGNSEDWRYVNVRRTLIYIEQSIRLALAPFAFEPNDANTWSAVIAMVTGFLADLWKQGGLAGAKPADAFAVACGLGQTMSSQDLLDGVMSVTIQLAITHPAEFLVLQIRQAMAATP
jgi:hypothetical protein